jgi:prepilin-type N-terminal cleavage/methylation domain-containing protein
MMHMRKSAFTLIELLVVVGIIAVLVAILMPALSQAREQANLIKCMAGARQVFLAVEMYCNDNRDAYPTVANDRSVPFWRKVPDPTLHTWVGRLVDLNYLAPLLQTNRGGCPYGPPPRTPTTAVPYECWPYDAGGGDYYSTTDDPLSVSYGLNGILQSGWAIRGDPPDGVNWWGYWSVWKRTSGPIRRNGSTVGVIFCSHVPWTTATADIYPAMWACLGLTSVYNPTSRPRHQGKALPVACADGHVETLGPVEAKFGPFNFYTPSGTTLYYHSTTTLYSENP